MAISVYTLGILRRMKNGERLFVRHRNWSASFYISDDAWGTPEWLDGEQIISDLAYVMGETMGRELLRWKHIKAHNVYSGEDCVINEYTLGREERNDP